MVPLFALLLLAGCRIPLQNMVVRSEIEAVHQELASPGNGLQPVKGPVWSWKFGAYRDMILVENHEIAIFDPMDATSADLLVTALEAKFPGYRVSLVVYSHSHHDHIRGAEQLTPIASDALEILAHQNVVRDLDWFGSDDGVKRPTRTLSGDETIVWNGIEIRLLYFDRSHSDSYLASWLPGQGVLYAPDMVELEGLGALDNDNFLPGYLKAQEALIALNPGVVIPGHYGLKTVEDLQKAHDVILGMRQIVREEMAKEGHYDAMRWQPDTYIRIQERWREAYGGLPGFEHTIVMNSNYLVFAWLGGF